MTGSSDGLERVIAQLLIVNGKLTRRLQAVSNLRHLTWSQVAVLARLDDGGPTTPADLARSEAVKPQSMSGSLANMEAEGLVERMPDPKDGRQILFGLTEEGRRTRKAVRVARQDWLRSAMASLSAKDLKILEGAAALFSRIADS